MKTIKGFYSFVNEQATDTDIKKCKVSEEGIQNVSPQMISDPPQNFPGDYCGYVISGEFKGAKYSWDLHGVEGMKGIRGVSPGYILAGYTEDVIALVKDKGIDLSDAKPKSPCIGFYTKQGKETLMAYPTKSGKCKVFFFRG